MTNTEYAGCEGINRKKPTAEPSPVWSPDKGEDKLPEGDIGLRKSHARSEFVMLILSLAQMRCPHMLLA